MAAYAALVSLSHVLNNILHPPPRHQLILDRGKIESLREKVSWLLDFLEKYSTGCSKEYENLERLIADAAYAAEDLIESDVMGQIGTEFESRRKKRSTSTSRGIKTAIKKFLSIQKELAKMIENKKGLEDLQPKSSTSASSSTHFANGKITMLGFDKHLIQIMSELTTLESNRQIISIVGMGGIGKTTLATAVYNHSYIVEYFLIRAWITVSQEYNVRELLLRILYQINKAGPSEQERSEDLKEYIDEMRKKSDDELGLLLHKGLFDRKYLIVMDDMWSMRSWEKLKMFLPDNKNGSRILVTTRLSNLTVGFESCNPYKMEFLDEGQSWDLLRKKIFVDEDCPVELEEIGKNIAKRCGGLPLALVVIAGLLAKSERTREHWKYVEGYVTTPLNYANDMHLKKILSLSYIHLPVYLKPCFLYLAVFPEDFEIRVSQLVRIWVAEAIIKPTMAKCLEEVAEEYLEDLINRNLVLVHKRGSSGKVKFCKIHDLIRDLCILEAGKEKFVYIAKLDNPNILPNTETEQYIISPSITVDGKACDRSLLDFQGQVFLSRSFSLLRVLDTLDRSPTIDISNLINLRYVAGEIRGLSRACILWNLQTLVLNGWRDVGLEIWQMPQLRHLKVHRAYLKDPPGAQMDGQIVSILENLQSLSTVRYFKCTEQVVETIPNLKKLRLSYKREQLQVENYCLNNLALLTKLESLGIDGAGKLWTDIAFPISLKKLTLNDCMIPWEDLSVVGSLPNLEVLKLHPFATTGEEWNPIEGDFCRLKFLSICVGELKIWGAENNHFPCLECLVLVGVKNLMEVPISFAEILTLQVIELYTGKDSLWTSAREISDQRELLGYEPLQLPRYNKRYKF